MPDLCLKFTKCNKTQFTKTEVVKIATTVTSMLGLPKTSSHWHVFDDGPALSNREKDWRRGLYYVQYMLNAGREFFVIRVMGYYDTALVRIAVAGTHDETAIAKACETFFGSAKYEWLNKG